MLQLATAVATLAVALPGAANASPGPRIALVFDTTASGLPAAKIRAALAAELGVELVDDLKGAEALLVVAVEPGGGRVLLTYQRVHGQVGRAVPLPDGQGDTATLLALLAANLVRNEALDLIAALSPPPSAPAPPPPFAEPAAREAPVRQRPVQPSTPPPDLARTAQLTQVAAAPEKPIRWWVMAGVGMGLGWTRSQAETMPRSFQGDTIRPNRVSGFASQGGYHVTPEVAWLARPSLLLGLQLRMQHVLAATDFHHSSCAGEDGQCHPPRTALALRVRAGWLAGLAPRLRLLLSGTVGVGRVRHVVLLEQAPPVCGGDGTLTCVDTVASDWLMVGPAGALFFDLHPRLSAYAGLHLLGGLRGNLLAVDAGAGLATRF